MSLKWGWRRVYADFFMPSRLGEYRRVVRSLAESGYAFHTIATFGKLLQECGAPPSGKIAILRQDVDTDISTAQAMWSIEQEYGAQTTRYFRQKTLAPDFMRRIAASGGEAGYHYEELSDLAKREGVYSAKELVRRLPEARRLFAQNLARIREVTHLPIRTVAAHGDFVNRKLRISNQELLADPALRAELRIDFETYDPLLSEHLDSRFCDRPHPSMWDRSNPHEAIASGAHIVYLLTHPRHWRVNIACNLRDDACRLWEGLRYSALTPVSR